MYYGVTDNQCNTCVCIYKQLVHAVTAQSKTYEVWLTGGHVRCQMLLGHSDEQGLVY